MSSIPAIVLTATRTRTARAGKNIVTRGVCCPETARRDDLLALHEGGSISAPFANRAAIGYLDRTASSGPDTSGTPAYTPLNADRLAKKRSRACVSFARPIAPVWGVPQGVHPGMHGEIPYQNWRGCSQRCRSKPSPINKTPGFAYKIRPAQKFSVLPTNRFLGNCRCGRRSLIGLNTMEDETTLADVVSNNGCVFFFGRDTEVDCQGFSNKINSNSELQNRYEASPPLAGLETAAYRQSEIPLMSPSPSHSLVLARGHRGGLQASGGGEIVHRGSPYEPIARATASYSDSLVLARGHHGPSAARRPGDRRV
jgi:hypothetical protein